MRVTKRDALRPGAELEVLLDAGVQVADAAAGVGDGLSVELQDQAKHPVGRRVLRSHVDDERSLCHLCGFSGEGVPVATAHRVDATFGGLARLRVRIVGGPASESVRSGTRLGVVGPVVVMTCIASARPAARSRRPCTQRGCHQGCSPCAADALASRLASRSDSAMDGRRR